MTTTALLTGDDRAAWLAERRTGIGSSDAAAICGLDRYRSALTVYLDKIGQPADEETNAAIVWGNKLEAVVADHFGDETGWDVRVPDGMVRSELHPFMVANIDRWLAEPDAETITALLEVKTTGEHLKDQWADGPPDRVLLQVAHQLAVTGLPRAFVAVLIGGRDFRYYPVERDDELISSLIEIEREFWDRVERRDPPAPDGSESSSDALRRLYEQEPDSVVDLPEEARTLLAALARTKAEAKVLKDEDRRLSNAVKALLGENHVGRLDGTKAVTWSRWTQQRLDRDALEADHPDLVARYLVDDPRDRLTLAKS